MNDTQYYVVIDGRQQGPLTAEALSALALTPATLVWRPGLSDWVKIADLPELAYVVSSFTEPPVNVSEPPLTTQQGPAVPPQNNGKEYYIMINGRREGPLPLSMMSQYGVTPATPVWCEGMTEWAPASTRPEVMQVININSSPYSNPYYDSYGNSRFQGAPYNNPMPNQAADWKQNNMPPTQAPPTNWLPWAIVGTIAGTLFSCIGCICGIVAIIQANKANTAYAQGNYQVAQAANSSAKIMTIITLCLAGLGLVTLGSIISTGMLSVFPW
ncbi:MAG: GYF domain-containing protein [Muribaculaceae bacterium]|nr:GYF domain-containing protein [Muribaculaceae bacterium]